MLVYGDDFTFIAHVYQQYESQHSEDHLEIRGLQRLMYYGTKPNPYKGGTINNLVHILTVCQTNLYSWPLSFLPAGKYFKVTRHFNTNSLLSCRSCPPKLI